MHATKALAFAFEITQIRSAGFEHLLDKRTRLQGIGTMFVRDNKVSTEELRKQQSAAANVVLRRQLRFLESGTKPSPREEGEDKVAPVGKVRVPRTDSEGMALLDDEGEQVVTCMDSQVRRMRA